jgi:hypothetical protein
MLPIIDSHGVNDDDDREAAVDMDALMLWRAHAVVGRFDGQRA